MGINKDQQIFARDIAYLILRAQELGIDLTFGEAWRSEYQQKEYVRLGRSWTMNSKHRDRLAVDFNFFIGGKLTYNYDDILPLGEYWESLSPKNEWGGFWLEDKQDTPHFQRNLRKK